MRLTMRRVTSGVGGETAALVGSAARGGVEGRGISKDLGENDEL